MVECRFRRLSWMLEPSGVWVTYLDSVSSSVKLLNEGIKEHFFLKNPQMDHFVCLNPPETGQIINSCFRGQWFF